MDKQDTKIFIGKTKVMTPFDIMFENIIDFINFVKGKRNEKLRLRFTKKSL